MTVMLHFKYQNKEKKTTMLCYISKESKNRFSKNEWMDGWMNDKVTNLSWLISIYQDSNDTQGRFWRVGHICLFFSWFLCMLLDNWKSTLMSNWQIIEDNFTYWGLSASSWNLLYLFPNILKQQAFTSTLSTSLL